MGIFSNISVNGNIISVNGVSISVQGRSIYVNGVLYGPVNMTPEQKDAFDRANAPMKGSDVTSGMTVKNVQGDIVLGPDSTLRVEGTVEGSVSATDVNVGGSVSKGVRATGNVKVGGSVSGGVSGQAVKAGGSISGGVTYEK